MKFQLWRHVLVLPCFAVALQPAFADAADAVPPILGTYNCVTSQGGHIVDRFESVNTLWRPWVRAVTTDLASSPGQPPNVGQVFVGYDPSAKRWNIVGVDNSGAHWTRHSTSPDFADSHWIDDDPNDGGRAIIRVSNGGAQYTFDLTMPKAVGRTVCVKSSSKPA